jgi:hypothetical protein
MFEQALAYQTRFDPDKNDMEMANSKAKALPAAESARSTTEIALLPAKSTTTTSTDPGIEMIDADSAERRRLGYCITCKNTAVSFDTGLLPPEQNIFDMIMAYFPYSWQGWDLRGMYCAGHDEIGVLILSHYHCKSPPATQCS